MAYEQPGILVGFLMADVDMSTKATWQFAPVWLAAASNINGTGVGGAALVAKGSLTTPPIGILQNNPVQGEPGTVIVSGVSKFIAGGTIAVGDVLTWKSDGTALIKATTGTVGVGRALSSAVSGDIATVLLQPLGIQ
jgi:hypothetical protein